MEARGHLTFIVNRLEATMFFCGIDVAKRKHVALIMNAAGAVTQRAFSIANSQKWDPEMQE